MPPLVALQVGGRSMLLPVRLHPHAHPPPPPPAAQLTWPVELLSCACLAPPVINSAVREVQRHKKSLDEVSRQLDACEASTIEARNVLIHEHDYLNCGMDHGVKARLKGRRRRSSCARLGPKDDMGERARMLIQAPTRKLARAFAEERTIAMKRALKHASDVKLQLEKVKGAFAVSGQGQVGAGLDDDE